MNAGTNQRTGQLANLSQGSVDDDFDIFGLIGILRRGILWLALCAVLALGAGYFYLSKVAIPLYTATSVVAINNRQPEVTDLAAVITGLGSDQSSINTEVEVIRSRRLIAQLVSQLNLADDPEFNPNLVQPSAFRRQLNKFRGRPENVQIPADQLEDILVANVLRKLSVVNNRQSYVFQLTFTTTSAVKSMEMANKLADLYIGDQVAVKRDAMESAISFLSDRGAELQIELRAAEDKLNSFTLGTELESPESLALKNRQLNDLRERLSTAQASVSGQQAQLQLLEPIVGQTAWMDDADLVEKLGLTEAVRRRNEGTISPADFTSILSELVNRTRANLQRDEDQIASLSQSIEQLVGVIERDSEDLLTLKDLERDAEANRILYEYFLGRLKETSIQQGVLQPDVRLLSQAGRPRQPASPRPFFVMAGFATIGIFLGSLFLFVREFRQKTIRVPEDLAAITNLQVQGQIPLANIGRRDQLLKYLVDRPNSVFVESVRNLRTSILMKDVKNPPSVVMFTSSVPGEGKTTLSIAMAKNFSGLGKKVLLIEADARRNTLESYFEFKVQHSLVETVLKDGSIAENASYDEALGFHILFGGNLKANEADFFSSAAFANLIKRARAQFDIVIIDTPPTLAVPDARIISQLSDAVVYAVQWDKTPRPQILAGLNGLASAGAVNIGLALTKINAKGMRRYGYGDSYGQTTKGYYHN